MSESKSQKYTPKFLRSGKLVKKGSSLLVAVPAEYTHKYNLNKGDEVTFFEYGKALLMVPLTEEEFTKLREELTKLILRKYLPATS